MMKKYSIFNPHRDKIGIPIVG